MNVEQHDKVEGEVKTEVKTIDVDALLKRVEQLETTNGRILDESKINKDKYRNLRDSVDKNEQSKLEDTESWKELLDISNNKNHSLTSEIKDLKTSGFKKELRYQVQQHAGNAYDVNDIVHNLSKDMLSLNEETNEVKGVAEAVARVRESKPHLFNVETKHGMTNSRPESAPPQDKTEDELINENPSAMLEQIIAQSMS